ncbi:CBR-PLL-1 protein [Loa loa]|uniref:Phosphoinositide phospholipase C n=1 Tax=Loa loa TaxID=7209 RepID=A0A1S0UEP1_LOALO|nr:CBR-PLL-1 protein [Loa loa]EJD74132.1 CBR-PLL-1 protein [Loa loa]
MKSVLKNIRSICDSQPSGSQPLATLRERWLGSIFDETDIEKCGCLSEKETVELIKKLNPRILLCQVEHEVKEASKLNPDELQRGKITRSQFVEIYKDVATRSEIYFLMVRYANKDYLSCKDLQLFLETEQGLLGITMEFCKSIIEQYEPCNEVRELNHMTVDGFTNYLYSDENFLFDNTHRNICQEMNQPFSNYFIATSFNTSLTEDQLKEPLNCQGYITALRRNCRFIEVDVWEPIAGTDEREPMIHNRYSTSKLTLSAVLNVINEMAFQWSKYPLFLRLEIHLNTEWQMILTDMLCDTFGDKLYQPKNDPTDWTERRPTPEDFQMKIILIGRRIADAAGDIGEVIVENENDMVQTDEVIDCLSKNINRMLICRKLSDLMCPWAIPTILKEMPLNTNNILNKHCHLLSSSEYNCLKMIQNFPSEFAQTAKDYLMLVTPDTSRTDSSNMNPQEFWNYGIQMVSLNYQTLGLMMDLQQGKFLENGGCGYVLKPSIMREELYTPGDMIPIPPQILYLRILSGQHLPRPRGSTAKGNSTDPYVVVEVFGCPTDCTEERTRTVKNDGVNPSFDESFQFEITVPEMALIRFLVLDDDFIDDDFIGQYTIPFECLKNGYRHLPLLNIEGEVMENCTLFVHVAITNRCGGGKARKRGMSVKRKNTRIVTGVKSIGIKLVDEYFKQAIAPLAVSIEMRSILESSLVKWRNDCGIGPAGTIRQGLRLMLTRTKTAAMNVSPPNSPNKSNDSDELVDKTPGFAICSDEKTYPMIVTRGVFPAQLQKTFDSMSELLDICAKILVNTEPLLSKLETATKRITECNDELSQLCDNAGLHGAKAARAMENFAWNVRLLKTHLTLMSKTQTEANNIVTQVFDVGCALGVLSEKSTAEICGKRSSRSSTC